MTDSPRLDPVVEAVCDYMDEPTVGSLYALAHVCVRTLSELENTHERTRRLEEEADPMPRPTPESMNSGEFPEQIVKWFERRKQRDQKWKQRSVDVNEETDRRRQLDSLLFEVH